MNQSNARIEGIEYESSASRGAFEDHYYTEESVSFARTKLGGMFVIPLLFFAPGSCDLNVQRESIGHTRPPLIRSEGDQSESNAATNLNSTRTQLLVNDVMNRLTGDFEVDVYVHKTLSSHISRYGVAAIEAIDNWLEKHIDGHSVLIETLRMLGDFDDVATKSARLAVLSTWLKHTSPFVRDAAARGLEDLNDKRAIDVLLNAASVEQFRELKKDYLMVVDGLRG